LKIKIVGLAGEGKSSIAYAIKSTLAEHGMNISISGCEDEKAGVIESTWTKRIKGLKGSTIEIETMRAKRGA
jgi:nitrogenase subunit NifH